RREARADEFERSDGLHDGAAAEVTNGRGGLAMRKITLLAFATAMLLPPGTRAGQTTATAATEGAPRIENAQRETRAADAGLVSAVQAVAQQAEKPTWIGYRVPRVNGERSICCGNYN